MANLTLAKLGGADLTFTSMEGAHLNGADFILKSWWWRVKEYIRHIKVMEIMFRLIKKLPLLSRINHSVKNGPTVLTGSSLKGVMLDYDPVLYRELLDEQYLDRFAEKHKILYPFWLLSSNCGRTVSLLFVWTLVIGLLIGLVFADFNSPGWLPNFMRNILDIVDPEFCYNSMPQTTLWQPLYLSFVTMTTLGVATAEPVNHAAYWWHTGQNLLGYVMLGYLIAVLGSKLTRRSG